MEQERARASALGYPDPVNPNYEATTEMYHKTLTECLRRIKVELFSFLTFKYNFLIVRLQFRYSKIMATMLRRLVLWWLLTMKTPFVMRSKK